MQQNVNSWQNVLWIFIVFFCRFQSCENKKPEKTNLKRKYKIKTTESKILNLKTKRQEDSEALWGVAVVGQSSQVEKITSHTIIILQLNVVYS